MNLTCTTENVKQVFLSRAEVARFLGCSRSSLVRWAADGEFPQPVKIGPRRVAFRRSEIEAWLADRPRVGASDSAGR